MKKIILLLFAFYAIGICYGQNEFSKTITQAALKQHLSVLAHDSLEGREAGTIGHEKAVDYLVRQYQLLGINPLTNEYKQTVSLPIKKWSLFDCRIRDVKERRYMFGRDFYILPSTRNPSLGGIEDKRMEIHWAGLGPLGDTLGLGISKKEDTKGDHKLWLLVDTLTSASIPATYWKENTLEKRIAALKKVVDGPIMVVTLRYPWWQQRIGKFWDEPAHGISTSRRSSSPIFVCGPRMARMFLRKASQNGLFQLWPLFLPYAKEGSAMEAFTFLNLQGLLNTWAEASIAGKPTGWPYLSAADSARFLLNVTTTTYTTPNVFAVIKGIKKPNEAVVLSAHSDHIGRNFFDIYNGADDDGTGTAALLVMAKAFKDAAKAGKGPERTLIFAHFTAEEKGLLGSNYYAEHPIWPMKSTFVNVNVDMIGRTDFKHQSQDRYVYSIGSEKLKPALKQLSEKVNKDCCQLDLDYFYDRPDDTEHLYERSDHYNFAKNGVPVIFYFSGLHPDYHGVNDEVSRIEWQKFEDRSKLIYNLVWQLTRKRTSLD